MTKNHVFKDCKCNGSGCRFCDDGLFMCTVCGGLEESLTTHCCGRQLTEDEEDRICHFDFKDGKWIDLSNLKIARNLP